jgi:uncharacterized protein YjdB
MAVVAIFLAGCDGGSITVNAPQQKAPMASPSLMLAPSQATLAPGNTVQMMATLLNGDGTTSDVTSNSATMYMSADNSIATVNSTGLVTAVAGGTTTITATTTATMQSSSSSTGMGGMMGGMGSSGGGSTQMTLSATATITVTGPAGGGGSMTMVTITPANPSVSMNNMTQLTATETMADGSQMDITSSATWSSSNTSIATVGNSAGTFGQVMGMGMGTATITATAADGTKGTTTVTVTM